MRRPVFAQIEQDLWKWEDWYIARDRDGFRLLTAAAREFGPFHTFELAKQVAEGLA